MDSNYFQDDQAFHSFSMREGTTGEVLTITNNGQENHLVKMVFLELKNTEKPARIAFASHGWSFSGINPLPSAPSEPSAKQTNC
ncbi:damage-inducible protein [Streptococcus pseudopneumoniae]|nr:damage-inducible protein [Streptococcus pseudopneumoniae]MBF9672250.1 damage-inducible protein [Streptococcus pseudopneumoniae]MBF9682684.1 damage-inducible protein [Streptococcus pseudopneumoniae]